MTNADEEFFSDSQKDVAGFISNFFTFMNEEFLTMSSILHSGAYTDPSPFTQTYGFEIQELQICSGCQNQKINFEYGRGLIFYASFFQDRRDQHLIDVLENDLIPRTAKLDCNECGPRHPHDMLYEWKKLPPCLVIGLRRYVYNRRQNRFEKICTTVSAPDSLVL